MVVSGQTHKLYGIHVPPSSFRKATCQEVHCSAYARGWSTTLLLGDGDFADKSYHDIRRLGFKYKMETQPDGFTRFTFEAGQQCFKGRAGAHRKRIEGSSELFYVKDRGEVIRRTASTWVDDFANHQINISDALERG